MAALRPLVNLVSFETGLYDMLGLVGSINSVAWPLDMPCLEHVVIRTGKDNKEGLTTLSSVLRLLPDTVRSAWFRCTESMDHAPIYLAVDGDDIISDLQILERFIPADNGPLYIPLFSAAALQQCARSRSAAVFPKLAATCIFDLRMVDMAGARWFTRAFYNVLEIHLLEPVSPSVMQHLKDNVANIY